MAYYWDDSQNELRKRPEEPENSFRPLYDRRSSRAEMDEDFRIGVIAVLCILAAVYGMWRLDEFPNLFDFSKATFWNGLAVGVVVGLVLHFIHRHRQKKAQEEQQILEELKEIKEQEKEEEYGYHNYRSSGM